MKVKCGLAIVSVAVSALVLCGCGPKQPWETAGVSEDFYLVTEDFAPRYLELDQDGQQYDQALDAVEAYLARESSQDEAAASVEQAVLYIETELEDWEDAALDEALTGRLQAVDISPVEYEAFANSRPTNLQSQQVDLLSLLYYLDYAEENPTSRENLSWSLDKDQKVQDSTRGYYYYGCLNYWFPGADDAEMAYLETQVIDKLGAYIPEDPTWCSTREDAEEQVMLYLDQVEEILNQFADHVGQQQNDLYQMEQELVAVLESQAEPSAQARGAE